MGSLGRWAGRSRLPPRKEGRNNQRPAGGRDQRSACLHVRAVRGLREIAPVLVSEDRVQQKANMRSLPCLRSAQTALDPEVVAQLLVRRRDDPMSRLTL